MNEFMMLGIVIGFIIGYPIAAWGAYRRGAWDAYYFAREPGHPGGRRAGRIIYRDLNHMYGDIPNPDEPTTTQRAGGEE